MWFCQTEGGARKRTMRKFPFITVGKVLQRLEKEGLKISRPTFLDLMNTKGLFQMQKTAGGWYTTSKEDMELIVYLILKNYRLDTQKTTKDEYLRKQLEKMQEDLENYECPNDKIEKIAVGLIYEKGWIKN